MNVAAVLGRSLFPGWRGDVNRERRRFAALRGGRIGEPREDRIPRRDGGGDGDRRVAARGDGRVRRFAGVQNGRSQRPAPDTVAAVRARRRADERRLALAIVLATLMVVAASLVLVWVRLQTVHAGYQLSAARHLAHRLEQEQRELELEIATLTSPPRLERVARERLGMTPPAPGQIVSVP